MYSKTCHLRQPIGATKSGLKAQVDLKPRFTLKLTYTDVYGAHCHISTDDVMCKHVYAAYMCMIIYVRVQQLLQHFCMQQPTKFQHGELSGYGRQHFVYWSRS